MGINYVCIAYSRLSDVLKRKRAIKRTTVSSRKPRQEHPDNLSATVMQDLFSKGKFSKGILYLYSKLYKVYTFILKFLKVIYFLKVMLSYN